MVAPEFPAMREDGPALKCFPAPDPVARVRHVTGGRGAGPRARRPLQV